MNSSAGNYCQLAMPQPLAVVLKAEASGPCLAREPVSAADLAEPVAETWRDLCLRRGDWKRPLADLAVTLVPLFPGGSRGPRCQGFALEITLPDGQVRRKEFHRRCLLPVATRGAEALAAAGILGPDLHYFYEVTLDTPAVPPASSPANSHGFRINVKSQPPACLRVPLRPLLNRAEPMGAQDEESFHVFFTAPALAKAEAFSRRGAALAPPVESGGVLVGSLACCDETKEFFVIVTDAIEVGDAEQTTFSLSYSGQSWSRIQTIMKARQATGSGRFLRLLGQTHGHNFLPNDGQRCDECDRRPVCSLTSVFVSQDDQKWMRAVFARQPWALCHIFGLSARQEPVQQLYSIQGGAWQARGYYVLPEFNFPPDILSDS